VTAAGGVHFDSQETFESASTDWPMSRFVEIWNSIPGNTEIKKFQDRKRAVARTWKAIQQLASKEEPGKQEPAKSARKGKAPKKTRAKLAAKAVRTQSDRTNKKAQIIGMLKRAKGATLNEIVEATGWQRHTVRGFVSILGSKGGEAIESSKNTAGERTYRIVK
jgi:hypothetical protein